ncbi:hypothetical protein G3576_05280 [Roseomonas stagni]|uniref:CopG family transcriptional regulator n=1 Tax=Falsiroseomonas algicola TaxID=2716930 RepID=A0A6M1LGX9_9PROT|nr:hypothetical protein [Falsiroseomonas algicola]NGM19417.1 hypothetical protein [Falsiroseomonas algicola]
MVRISVELPDEVAEALGRLAHGRQSTPAALLSRWAEEATAFQAELDSRLTEGLADLAAGRTASHEEVMADLQNWAEDLEARHRDTR